MNLEEAHNVIFIERLRAKSTTNEKGCWLIHTSLDKDGYHVASYRGKSVKGYKKAFLIKKGEIPKGLVLDHYYCQNRNCCNPDHLEPVTPQENTRRGRNYNREKTHCPQGHAYTPENTHYEKKGNRHCKVCQKLTNQKLGGYRLQWQRNNKDKLHEYYLKQQKKRMITHE